jgi:hypothetical protein
MVFPLWWAVAFCVPVRRSGRFSDEAEAEAMRRQNFTLDDVQVEFGLSFSCSSCTQLADAHLGYMTYRGGNGVE